jgi:Mitochondrial glycoprotein
MVGAKRCDGMMQLIGRFAVTRSCLTFFLAPVKTAVAAEPLTDFAWCRESRRRAFSGKGKYYTIKDFVPRPKKGYNWVENEEKDEPDAFPRRIPKKSTVARVFTLSDFVTRAPTEQRIAVHKRMPEHIKKYLRALRPRWQVLHLGSAITKLYRINTSRKIVLSFHCQDATLAPSTATATTTTPKADRRAEQWQNRDEMLCRDHDAPVVPPPVIFTLTATKNQQSLVFIGVARDDAPDENDDASATPASTSAIQIHHVSITRTPVDILHATGAAEYLGGRHFSQLSSDQQSAWNSFVKLDVGLDRDVANFITSYFVYREECQYERFLYTFHDFVQDDETTANDDSA